MDKALEITRDIVVAALNATKVDYFPDSSTGNNIAGMIQVIYDKVKELEKTT